MKRNNPASVDARRNQNCSLYSLKQYQSSQIRGEGSVKAPRSVTYFFLENKFFLQLHRVVNLSNAVQIKYCKSTVIIQRCLIIRALEFFLLLTIKSHSYKQGFLRLQLSAFELILGV